MTDRDAFAAAAMAGYLANGDYSTAALPVVAYELADAMLRERERRNHGAAPAARASESPCAGHAGTGGTPNDATPMAGSGPTVPANGRASDCSEDGRVRASASSIGNTRNPVAWAVVYPNDEVAVIAFKRLDAEERASASDRIIPLYRQPQPTLTDSQRVAIESAADDYRYHQDPGGRAAFIEATLRGLLERLT